MLLRQNDIRFSVFFIFFRLSFELFLASFVILVEQKKLYILSFSQKQKEAETEKTQNTLLKEMRNSDVILK